MPSMVSIIKANNITVKLSANTVTVVLECLPNVFEKVVFQGENVVFEGEQVKG